MSIQERWQTISQIRSERRSPFLPNCYSSPWSWPSQINNSILQFCRGTISLPSDEPCSVFFITCSLDIFLLGLNLLRGLSLGLGFAIILLLRRARNVNASLFQACVDLGDCPQKRTVLINSQRDTLVICASAHAPLIHCMGRRYLFSRQVRVILLVEFPYVDELHVLEVRDLDSPRGSARRKLKQ